MNAKDLLNGIIGDVRVELTEEFDRNFERKSFFDKPWKQTSLQNGRGSVLSRSGALRRSIKSKVSGGQITFSSALPYATIHNEGGEIIVTEKMKRFFWAMFYKSSNAVLFNVKKKAMANTKRNRKLSAEAQQWKNLALMKTGQKMKIEQRQFIGDHPKVREIIENSIDANVKQFADELFKNMKR